MTYQDFFKLKDTPFRLTPDLDYFFRSEGHGNALETLLYSIRSGEGFVQITGQPGVGKTILVRHLLNQLGDKVKTALILHPRLNAEELLKVILEDLGVSSLTIQNNTKEGLLRFFRDYLLEKARSGCTTVVIVDEAQEIPDDTLEELRLLSNLETEKKKLLSIILVGQTELEEKLNRPSLGQLHQRITIRYRIEPFTRNETEAYIFHRLAIAGATGNIRFSKTVLNAIHKKSRGIPRRINIICERALMAASIEGVNKIGNSHLKSAIESYLGVSEKFYRFRYAWPTIAFSMVILITGAMWWAFFPDLSKSLALYEKASGLFKIGSNSNIETPDQTIINEPSGRAELSKRSTNTQAKTAAATLPGPGNISDPDQTKTSPKMQTDSKTKTVEETPGNENIENPPVVMMPENWHCILIDRHLGQGQVWEGTGSSVRPALSFAARDISLADGIYILGKDANDQPFIFNHHDFSPRHWFRDLAEQLWEKFGHTMELPAVPVIVRSGESISLQTHPVETSRDISNLVNDWASAWRSADIETYIQYYGRTLMDYHPDQNVPNIISREKYFQQKGELFQKKIFIALQISTPVCIIDPAKPDSAVAVFQQRYATSHYMDEGIKMLFLRQTKQEENAKPTWIIEGRFWIPFN